MWSFDWCVADCKHRAGLDTIVELYVSGIMPVSRDDYHVFSIDFARRFGGVFAAGGPGSGSLCCDAKHTHIVDSTRRGPEPDDGATRLCVLAWRPLGSCISVC